MSQKSQLSADKPFASFSLFLKGFLMGCADMVPGVSGGTVAFVSGIYENLFKSIRTINLQSLSLLFRFRFRDFFSVVAWEFLLVLLSGMMIAIFSLSRFFSLILNSATLSPYLFGLFWGLILGSAIYCGRLLQTWNRKNLSIFFIGAILAFSLTHIQSAKISLFNQSDLYEVPLVLSPAMEQAKNYNAEKQLITGLDLGTISAMSAKGILKGDEPLYSSGVYKAKVKDLMREKEPSLVQPFLILAGSLAISAMLLPGISGSFILYILGVYPYIIEALSDLGRGMAQMKMDWEAFLILSNLAIGVILGAVCFSRIVSTLFQRYRDGTISLLTGFMLGAIHSVWPFRVPEFYLAPLKLDSGLQLRLGEAYFPSLFTLESFLVLGLVSLGCMSVATLEYLSAKKC